MCVCADASTQILGLLKTIEENRLGVRPSRNTTVDGSVLRPELVEVLLLELEFEMHGTPSFDPALLRSCFGAVPSAVVSRIQDYTAPTSMSAGGATLTLGGVAFWRTAPLDACRTLVLLHCFLRSCVLFL